ncbi:MAG TPA: hypothetical protein VKV96_12185 [Roseiarcus sp.]|nr:hypothetical protein [Roseiarcus sp.]
MFKGGPGSQFEAPLACALPRGVADALRGVRRVRFDLDAHPALINPTILISAIDPESAAQFLAAEKAMPHVIQVQPEDGKSVERLFAAHGDELRTNRERDVEFVYVEDDGA